LSSKIIIHSDVVKNSIAGLDQNIDRLLNIQSNVAGFRYSIDHRIYDRNGIGRRIAAACASMDEVEANLNRIKNFASNSVSKYSAVEARLNHQAAAIDDKHNLAQKILNGRYPSDTYELYNNTISRLQDVLHGLQYMGGAGVLHLLGFKFSDVDGILRRFELADDVLLGKTKLPIGSIIKKIEGSKLNFLARMMVNPMTLFRHKNKSLGELIYKRFASFFPKDIVNLSNSVATLKNAVAQSGATFTSGLNAVKNNTGAILRASGKLVKSNAILATVITAGTEAVGAGIKITENYSIYGGDIETLKEENAKVVGRAVYKTAVVSATSVAGAAIGGTIGSLAGPIGTVAGAAVGGFLGSMLGDKLTENTPAFVDKAAVHFKEGIYKGTEAVASGVNKVKEGFNDVKEHAGNLLNSSKKLFNAFSFGN
jgi:Glycine zipper